MLEKIKDLYFRHAWEINTFLIAIDMTLALAYAFLFYIFVF